MSESVTERQLEVLEILWANGSATSGEIIDHMKGRVSASTVRTLLNRMQARGLIGHDNVQYGRKYTAAVTRDVIEDVALDGFIDKHYEGSAEALYRDMVDEGLLDPPRTWPRVFLGGLIAGLFAGALFLGKKR